MPAICYECQQNILVGGRAIAFCRGKVPLLKVTQFIYHAACFDAKMESRYPGRIIVCGNVMQAVR